MIRFKKILSDITQFFKRCLQYIKAAFTDTTPAPQQSSLLKPLSRQRINIANFDPKQYYPIALRDNALGFKVTKHILRHTDLTAELNSNKIVSLIELHQHRFATSNINIDILLRIKETSLFELALSSTQNALKILRMNASYGKFSALALTKIIHKHRANRLMQQKLCDCSIPQLGTISTLLTRADQEGTLGAVWDLITSSLTLLTLLHLEYKGRLEINLDTSSTIFNPYDILDLHQESSKQNIKNAFKNKLCEIQPTTIEDLYSTRTLGVHTAYAILSKEKLKSTWDIKHAEKEDKEELAAQRKIV